LARTFKKAWAELGFKTNMAAKPGVEKYVLELRKKVETLRETDNKVGETERYIK
jgi:hypothetical protein